MNGKLEENIYNNNLEFIKNNTQHKGEISFIKDDIGYHNIKNINNDITVSMHIYSPALFIGKYF